MRNSGIVAAVLFASLPFAWSCAQPTNITGPDGTGGAAGQTVGTGGSSTVEGSSTGTGGASTTGASLSTGGSPTGGSSATATGGSTGSDVQGAGGSPGTGGSLGPSTGGATATGGHDSVTGGASGTGGSVATGGPIATGGTTATGTGGTAPTGTGGASTAGSNAGQGSTSNGASTTGSSAGQNSASNGGTATVSGAGQSSTGVTTSPGSAGQSSATVSTGGSSTGGGVSTAGTGGSTATGTGSTGAVTSTAGGTIVPLYTDPTDPSWNAIIAAAEAHPTVHVVAIVNPNNGPGATQDSSYSAGIADLQAANIKVIGYVATGYGSHSIASMEAEIDTWKSFYPTLQGIFFDEQSDQVSDVAHYQTLSQYAKSVGLSYTVGNPGTGVPTAFVGAVDTMLIYESNGVPPMSDLSPYSAYPPSNFGVIPYAVSAMNTTFVQQARQYVEYVYVTNDDLPNPWDSLSSYFSDLLTALE